MNLGVWWKSSLSIDEFVNMGVCVWACVSVCQSISNIKVNIYIFKSHHNGWVDGRLERTLRPARNLRARQAFPEDLGRESQTEKQAG